MKKRLLIIAAFILSLVGVFSLQENTYAETCSGNVLGLPVWCDGIELNPSSPYSEEELASVIWTIVMNVMTMVLGVVGYLAVGFVIWGGFLYLFSTGDPGRAAKGKKTITNSLIGTVICIIASTITGAISGIISGAASQGNVGDFFSSIFNHAFIWGGILCVLMIVIGGISYATSVGNPSKITKAKSTIVNSAIGLVIIVLSAAIVNFVVKALLSGEAA